MRKISFILAILLLSLPIQAQYYNVRDYGAKGDGKTLDHIAINKAIDACVADGGGQVLLPAGTYLCGSIRMKSNVNLHLMAGAKILAADPKKFPSFGGTKGGLSFGGTKGGSTMKVKCSADLNIRMAGTPISIIH